MQNAEIGKEDRRQKIASDDLFQVLGPKVVHIEVTNLCNLRCMMCNRWQWALGHPERQGNLRAEDVFQLIEDLRKLGTRQISFVATEPLLRPDILDIVQAVRNAGIKPEVYTNGTLMTPALAAGFASSRANLAISVDGLTEVTHDRIRGVRGAFRRALSGIHELANARREADVPVSDMRITVSFTVQKANLPDLMQDFRNLDMLGADVIRFGLVHGPATFVLTSDDGEALARFVDAAEKQASELRCRLVLTPYIRMLAERQIDWADFASGNTLRNLWRNDPVACYRLHYAAMVDAFGGVYPCVYTYYDNQGFDEFKEARAKFCVGNIHERSFADIWRGDGFRALRSRLSPVDPDESPLACGCCEYYSRFKEMERSLCEARAFGRSPADLDIWK